GVSRDATYGPVVAVGLGGVFVEVLRDTALRLPPLALADAHEMLDELAGAALLDAVRGRPARDRAAVADLLVRLSWLAVDLAADVEEIDINPVLVRERGSGAIAVDALIVRKAAIQQEVR
ncbi:MAG: acetate--CoA ligase family protein, partial [Acidobacteria bacterium]|nr:acetate--CoA ligase family protein [Acidobacteriota bacterium]